MSFWSTVAKTAAALALYEYGFKPVARDLFGGRRKDDDEHEEDESNDEESDR